MTLKITFPNEFLHPTPMMIFNLSYVLNLLKHHSVLSRFVMKLIKRYDCLGLVSINVNPRHSRETSRKSGMDD
jgi:hypothetical protein